MKVTSWNRALAAFLVAGGLLGPGKSAAAELGVNLVANADFEDVDLAVTGEHNGPRIRGWSGRNAFAYSHDGSSSTSGVVPNYALGETPPNAGHWYFTATNTGGRDLTEPDDFYQDFDVSTGATGGAIATGQAYYHLSGVMSSAANDDGRPVVQLHFFNSNDEIVDIDGIGIPGDDGPHDVWGFAALSQQIQTNVTRIRISLFGDRQTGGYNGYVDNVELRISPEPSTLVIAALAFSIAGMSCTRRRSINEREQLTAIASKPCTTHPLS